MDELDLRGFSQNTKDNYVGAIDRLARHFHKAPDRITDEELKQYLLFLIRDQQRSASTMSVINSACRFFFKHVLHRSTANVEDALPRVRKKTIRPRIYSPEEIEQLLSVEGVNPKHRALLMTTYAAGLRVSEACNLKVTDIMSSRMQIRVDQGKGGRIGIRSCHPVCCANCVPIGGWCARRSGCSLRPAGWGSRCPSRPPKPFSTKPLNGRSCPTTTVSIH